MPRRQCDRPRSRLARRLALARYVLTRLGEGKGTLIKTRSDTCHPSAVSKSILAIARRLGSMQHNAVRNVFFESVLADLRHRFTVVRGCRYSDVRCTHRSFSTLQSIRACQTFISTDKQHSWTHCAACVTKLCTSMMLLNFLIIKKCCLSLYLNIAGLQQMA